MSLSTNKPVFKINSIHPYSTYLARSYSPAIKSAKQTDQQKQQQDFNCFVQGWGIKELTNELQKQSKKLAFRVVKHEKISDIKKLNFLGNREDKKKIAYRTRQTKTIYRSTSYSPEKKLKITSNKALQTFYRYQIVSLLGLLNRREDYINYLRGKNQDLVGDPMKPNQIQEKLLKQLQTKGKDKGRQKFNYLISQQLRSLKYKPKYASNSPTKKSKVQQKYLEEEEEQRQGEEENENTNMDINTWRRKNGVGYYQKVFIIKGGYHELRRCFLEKGWYENQDVWSPFYDFKWTTRICDINYFILKHSQAVNHFNNNHHLTSKYGLTRRLRTLILGHNIDVDKFYPRCYDLGDQVDFENFVQNFKFGFAESVARRFLVDKKRYRNLQLKIRITLEILKRRTLSFNSKLNEINKCEFSIIKPEEWEIITEKPSISQDEKANKLKEWRKKDPIQTNFNDENYESLLYEIIDVKVRGYLQILKKQDPQIQMNGFRNIWICKPNFMSRGRGIRCYNNIYDITDYCLGGTGQFVVQKYIEHPLVIEGKKFDIRQWVLIQDFCPPKIWFYNDCYIRFCADDFSLQNIYNRHIHLTNNSVQKYNKNGNIDKSMWTMGQFAEYIGEQKWKGVQQKMKNIIVWSIKSCEGYVIGRKGSCEFVGYDFMIDQNLDPWLIQINMSPSMQHSTPITKKMVKKVLNDTFKVISSNKKSRDTGLYSCIYQGNNDLQKYEAYKI